TIASGAALLYGSGGTSGTPTANSGETVVMERTRREEEEGDDPNPEEGNDQQNESLPMSEMTMIDGGSITLDREPAYGQSIVPVTIATGTHSSEITSNQQVTARGGEVTKPKPYPIDPSLNAKPITVQKEVYSLSDSDKKAIAELKTKLSGIKVSDNEPEMVKTREAIAYKNNYFIENLGKVGTEIQDLKEKIDRTKKEIDDLKKGNGLFTSTVDPTVLQMNLTSDLQKLETLNKEYNSIQGKYQDYNTKDTKKEMDHARELALTRLQDSVIENPFRQELRLNELALMGMEKGTFEYKETDARIKILKDNVSEFEKAKDLLLNSSGDMQAKAAEYMLSVNPNLTIPYPTHKTETLTLSNSQAQPGFFSSPKFEGVLPGANVPGAIVSANEEDHKARHGISDYYAVDIALPHGTPYNAVAPGIAEVKYDDPKRGNYVKITHDHGLSTIYMHNSDFLVDDSKPVAVDPTTPIARVGNTGNTRSDYPKGPPLNGGSHIHFEIHLDGKRVPINSFDWDRYKNEGKTYLDEVRKRLEK
ncbi:M23 family metallopeptidase, partial [Leptospira bouyouniensis]